MARAVIEIVADTQQLERSLTRVMSSVGRAARSVKDEFSAALRVAEEQARRTADAAEAAAAKIRAANRAISRAARAEATERATIAQGEAGYREAAARVEERAAERVEKARTAAARRGAQERQRIYADELRARRAAEAGRIGERAGGAAMTLGSTAINMTRSAVTTAAAIESRMNDALVPAGFRNPAELAAAQRAILERARSRGIDSGQIASGLAEAQEFTSVLSGRTAADRQQNLAGALDDAEFAADSRQNMGQLMMLRGIMAQQGVRGRAWELTRNALTGISRAGSVEIGNLIKEGRGPLMQNLSFAMGQLGPNATDAQRAEAARRAAIRTIAVSEVAAGGGLSVRDSLNAMAKLDRFTINDRGMGLLRDRLRAQGAQGQALADQMFGQETDRSGRRVYRLQGRYRDSLNLMSELIGFHGGNAAAAANMLGAGGPGSPMVMDAQMRRMMLGLASQTSNGETVEARVRRMTAEGNYTESDLAQERQIRMGEQTTRLTTNAETQRQVLSDNTSQLNRLNKNLEEFQSKNPIAAQALGMGAAAAAPSVGRMIMTTISGAGAYVGRAGTRLLGRVGGGIGALADILRPSNDDQGYFDDRAAIRAARGGADARQALAAGQRDSIQQYQAGMRDAVAQGVREGLASSAVQVPPAAQQHAQTQQALNSGSTPTTGR